MNEVNLINNHTDEVIDIIGSKIKNKKELNKNKEKIIKLLNETNNITEELLTQPVNFIKEFLPEDALKADSIKEFHVNIIRFCEYIIETGDNYKDKGYSMLISYYFYLSNLLK